MLGNGTQTSQDTAAISDVLEFNVATNGSLGVCARTEASTSGR
jgi:hypothetical protein